MVLFDLDGFLRVGFYMGFGVFFGSFVFFYVKECAESVLFLVLKRFKKKKKISALKILKKKIKIKKWTCRVSIPVPSAC